MDSRISRILCLVAPIPEVAYLVIQIKIKWAARSTEAKIIVLRGLLVFHLAVQWPTKAALETRPQPRDLVQQLDSLKERLVTQACSDRAVD